TAGSDVVFGSADRQYLPLLSDKATVVGGVYINASDLLSVGLGIVALVLGHLVVNRTGLGVSLRASAEDPAVARIMGIDVLNLRTGVWAASGLLAAIAAMAVVSRLVPDARYGRLAIRLVPIAVAVLLPFVLDNYWVFTLTEVMIYAIATIGLDLVFGRAGQLSLAQATLFGVGAYLTALTAAQLAVGLQ